MSRRYLITGAQGFVGRYLGAFLLSASAENEVVGIGRSPRTEGSFTHFTTLGSYRVRAPIPEDILLEETSDRYIYAQADILDKNRMIRVLRENQPNAIFHLASGLRDDPPDFLFRTGVEGTIRLMEAIEESSVAIERVVLGSTGGVYGNPDPEHLPLDENGLRRPIDLYSASKLAAETVASILSKRTGIPVMTCRLFNIVGAGQDERHVCGKFASWLSSVSRKEIPPVIEVGDLGTTRDFVDVRDAAVALELLERKGAPGQSYNIASGNETRIGTILSILLGLSGLEGTVEVRQRTDRADDIPRHYGSTRKLREAGFSPTYSLEQSLQDVLNYYHRIAPKARSFSDG
jgi:GDP-4-dehydro-6-deoxy-D-mannose reductase